MRPPVGSPRPLALSLGDPAGIGPEIVVKAWRALRGEPLPFVVVGDADALSSASGRTPERRVGVACQAS